MTDEPAPDPEIVARLERAKGAQQRFEILYSVLRDRISMLEYSPGQQLSEEALAAEFGISRSPLRKALKILEADGLIQSQQGVGTLVTDVDIDELSQVYQLRMELNELTGRLTPVEPGLTLLREFKSMRNRAQTLASSPTLSGFARLNIDFFHVFQKLTANAPLQDVSEKLFYQTCRIWLKHVSDMNVTTEISIFCGEICEICDAVELGDIQAAALIRKAHLSMGYTRLRSHAKTMQLSQ